MGGILSNLFDSNSLPADLVSVEFDKIQEPSDPAEAELYGTTNELVVNGEATVKLIEEYKGCAELIRAAMASPSDEQVQLNMFEGMFPNVERIKTFYTLAKSIDEAGAKLTRHFIDSGKFSPALLKMYATMLNVALKFDRAKMMHPEIQNDFSQYRRALAKNQRHPGIPVNDIEANNVSMFVAPATPCISSLSQSLDAVQRQGKDVAKFLADFSHICCSFAMKDKENKDSVMALTAMTVAFVLYDNISPVGVFGKGSQIEFKTCVSEIRKISNEESKTILCDTLRFSTRSYDKAPDVVKKWLEGR